MKHIYIFRHGQTDLNVANRWQGCECDASLNNTGFEQANALGKKVKHLGIKTLFSSPLIRAIQTSKAIAQQSEYEIPIIVKDDLRECCFGDVEGLTYNEVRKKYGDFVETFFNPTEQTWDCKFPNGESKHEVFLRVIKTLKEIASLSDDNIGVVCHAGVLSSLACGLDLHGLSWDNCSILHLAYDCTQDKFIYTKD